MSKEKYLEGDKGEKGDFLPLIYFVIAVILSTVVLVIIYAAGAMTGYPDPVYDSQFKVFTVGEVTGDQFSYTKPGNFESGSDWSQGWECYGGNKIKDFYDVELAKKDAKEDDIEKKIKTLCEAETLNEEFICCSITKAPQGIETHSFAAYKGSKLKWSGVSKSLLLPPKRYTDSPKTFESSYFDIPYNTEKWYKMGDTSKRPPWNNGFNC